MHIIRQINVIKDCFTFSVCQLDFWKVQTLTVWVWDCACTCRVSHYVLMRVMWLWVLWLGCTTYHSLHLTEQAIIISTFSLWRKIVLVHFEYLPFCSNTQTWSFSAKNHKRQQSFANQAAMLDSKQAADGMSRCQRDFFSRATKHHGTTSFHVHVFLRWGWLQFLS